MQSKEVNSFIKQPVDPSMGMMMQSQEAVYNLLDRIMPELSSQFDVEIDASKVNTVEEEKDVVRLVKSASKNPTASEATAEARAEAKIVVQASSGVAAAWGIHHYLKYYVGSHFSWDTTRSCRPTSSVPSTHIVYMYIPGHKGHFD